MSTRRRELDLLVIREPVLGVGCGIAGQLDEQVSRSSVSERRHRATASCTPSSSNRGVVPHELGEAASGTTVMVLGTETVQPPTLELAHLIFDGDDHSQVAGEGEGIACVFENPEQLECLVHGVGDPVRRVHPAGSVSHLSAPNAGGVPRGGARRELLERRDVFAGGGDWLVGMHGHRSPTGQRIGLVSFSAWVSMWRSADASATLRA